MQTPEAVLPQAAFPQTASGALADTVGAGTPHLDPARTLALAVACAAAYDDLEGKPLQLPDGWRFIERWTGWDAVLKEGREERYGLLLGNDEGDVIAAFRGTESLPDVWEDLDFELTDFVPSFGAPERARVSTGFYSVYDDIGGQMPRSMRAQLLLLLQQLRPQRLWVTGHSLGGALAQLFAFDLSFGPYAQALQAAITFASPRVGDIDWRSAYEARIPGARSVRVFNQHDLVPKLPPHDLRYHAVGPGVPTAFARSHEVLPHYLPRHSILNLTAVLRQALPATPQVWAGEFEDASHPGERMRSTLPNPPEASKPAG
jgi:pimeloyl-ACP methyl ester carboxylesterase